MVSYNGENLREVTGILLKHDQHLPFSHLFS